MTNQYELGLEQDVQSYYVDQTPIDSAIQSYYTSYGIKCIDSQFCQLILNLHRKIKQVYAIRRRQEESFCNIKTREVHLGPYRTYYDPIDLSECNGYIEIRIEWENGFYHDFQYSRTPMFDLKTRNTNPIQLKKAIKECPNLHVNIKENLLDNLERTLIN